MLLQCNLEDQQFCPNAPGANTVERIMIDVAPSELTEGLIRL